MRLKRFWRSPKTTSSEDSTGYESPTRAKTSNDVQRFNHLHYTSLAQNAPSHDGGADSEGGGIGGNSNKGKSTLGVGGGIGSSLNNKPTCSLPLLQVWPSQVGTIYKVIVNTHSRKCRVKILFISEGSRGPTI